MHRVDTSGSVGGLFDNGNPSIGQLATQLTQDWFNDVQENLAYVIESNGLELEKGNYEQLAQAMVALVAGAVGAGGGAVPTTRQVIAAGLATGGGDLSADRTITVTKASSAEVLAGSNDTKAITPLALATASAVGLVTNGYEKRAGGLMLAWGQVRGTYVEGSVSVTFPEAFNAAPFAIILTSHNQAGSTDRDIFMQNVSRSPSGFTAYFQYDGDGTDLIQGFDYVAIGKWN